ncbi:hypothetical protein HYQ44_016082 [Verticillium longisporum]|nr:hypothetical protein HYQ44_016082 [Verticillium longisporum]
MATTEPAPSPHDRSDRPGRRRPFSTWVKKLTTNFKNSSSDGQLRNGSESKRLPGKKGHKKHVSKNNNPYPQSGRVGQGQTNHSSHSFSSTGRSGSATSLERSVRSDDDGPPHTAGGARSLAPTVATDHEAPHSMVAPSQGASSVAGTNRTAGGIDSRRGGDSTFSIYSTSGVATMLSERNSFYAKQQRDAGDGASTRSGFLGHGRADSISGSIGGVASPLVSPRERAAVEETMEERMATTADVRGKEREDDGR